MLRLLVNPDAVRGCVVGVPGKPGLACISWLCTADRRVFTQCYCFACQKLCLEGVWRGVAAVVPAAVC
jgi:hypothetical protein